MHAVLAKLNLHSPQTRGSEEAVRAIIARSARTIERRHDLFRAGDRPRSGFIAVDGWAIRHKCLTDGRRQVTALLLPGDIFDLHTYLAREVDDTVTAVTAFTVAPLSKEDFEQLTDSHPCLTKAFLWEELVEMAVDREWVLNVGQRTGHERLAHLICEIMVRLRMVGLSDTKPIRFPLTQAQLAEMTGLTPVHVNRVLKALRSEDLVRLDGRRLSVPDLKKLMKRASFEPGYLHLEGHEARLTAA